MVFNVRNFCYNFAFMKKIYLLTALLCLLVLQGCPSIAPAEEDAVLTPIQTTYSIGAEGGSVSLSFKTNLEYEVSSDADWLTVPAGTKAVETKTVTVTAAENTSTEQRSGNITITGGELTATVTVQQAGAQKKDEGGDDSKDEGGDDPVDAGNNLSANGTANCYVVTEAGAYTFDAGVMGNGEKGFIWTDDQALAQHLWPEYKEDVNFSSFIYDGAAGPAGVKVLWQDGGVIDGDPVYDAESRTIGFTASGNEGNALLSLVNKNGKVLWSWHIWCTDAPAQQRYITADGTGLTLLDRNLGATSADASDGEATYGLWYQFGRKDPLKLYYNVKNSMWEPEADLQHSVEHPAVIYRHSSKTNEWFNNSAETVTADLWGNPFALNNGNEHHYTAALSELNKTIYDPCPPGYMVPPEWTWTGLNMDICSESEYGLSFEVADGRAFYPFAGYGDAGDMYGGDNGWYGYRGFAPTEANKDSSGYHHNEITIVAVWSSATTVESAYGNFIRGSMFFFHRKPESDFVKADMSAPSSLYAYPDGDAMLYSALRARCASVRCMRIPD